MRTRFVVAFIAIMQILAGIACSAELNDDERRIVEFVDKNPDQALSLLIESVKISSATENLDGVRKSGDLFRGELDRLSFSTRWIPMPQEMKRAGHLFAEHAGTQGKRLLLIGHLDTVLPGGVFSQKGDRGYGSGSNDMKGGDVILVMALRALNSIGALDKSQIIVAFTGDEESAGRPIEVSRRDLIDAAKRSDVALAFENAIRDTVTTARRGASTWNLEVTGIQAHSSGIFSDAFGDGAIFEAARILDEFRIKLRQEKGLTFNPSVIVGGTDASFSEGAGSASGKANVIPRIALVRGDLRFSNQEQLDRARQLMRDIVTRHLRRTDATISFEDLYPAMIETPGSLALLGQMNDVSEALGQGKLVTCDPMERGAGDVSFVATIIPSIDGLGARGQGAHAPGEFVDEKSLNALAKRTAVLIYRLTR